MRIQLQEAIEKKIQVFFKVTVKNIDDYTTVWDTNYIYRATPTNDLGFGVVFFNRGSKFDSVGIDGSWKTAVIPSFDKAKTDFYTDFEDVILD